MCFLFDNKRIDAHVLLGSRLAEQSSTGTYRQWTHVTRTNLDIRHDDFLVVYAGW
jgi:hypothetical protein